MDRVGARFGGVCSGSSARPEQFRGGMCVRMEKWREDAQPEWPQAASATTDVPVIGGEAQAFPETGAARGSDILEGGRHAAKDGRRATKDGRRIRTGWPEPPAGKGAPIAPIAPVAGVGAGILADPWGAPAETGMGTGTGAGTGAGAADPDEVTVQLDGPAPELGDPHKKGAGHDDSDGPVFVDESGRRSRRYRRIGMAIGFACAAYAVVIVVTLLSGSSDAPWLPVPGQKNDPPAGKVDTKPLPAESGRPSGGSGSVAPGNIPTASDGTTPSPGASASRGAPGASKAPGKASASASAGPSVSASASATAGGGGSNPVVQPTRASSSPPAGPTPSNSPVTTPDPTPTPTPSATTGTGTVADAPSTPSPVAQEPAASEPAAPAPSKTPEHIL